MKKLSHYIFGLLALVAILYITGCSVSTPKSDSPSNYLRQSEPKDVPIIFAPGIVSVKGRFDMGFTMTADGKNIAFGVVHESDPSQTNIHFLNWKNGDWTGPTNKLLANNINTSLPMFSPKGNQLYFAKADDQDETDLWVADFNTEHASTGKRLTAPLNSDKREAGHGKGLNGAFYFTSNRDDRHQCCGDIYRTSPSNPEEVEKVSALSSDADEEGLFLSPNEDYIIIQAWKNKYQTKHDLYISYRTDENRWTTPIRLNDKINSPEIEQRPFVSSDNQHLFFSRMSIEEKSGQTLYESDIYWVSTKEVFGPYLNKTVNAFTISGGDDFTIQLPLDLFKDIDDPALQYSITLANGSPLPAYLSFDHDSMTLSGKINTPSTLALIVKAVDDDQNEASTYIELINKR